MILVDDRGDTCRRAVVQLTPLVTVPVQVQRLEEGDVQWVGKCSAVWCELKTAADLLTSLGTKHMQDQEARLLELDGARFLFVVGGYWPGERGETWVTEKDRPFEYPYAGVVNYLSRVQELGIGVVHVIRTADLGRALAATYLRSLKTKVSVIARRKVEHLDPRVQALKCVYPYLNLKAAEQLVLKYAGGWKWVPESVTEKELTSLEGVGRLTARRLLGHG